ncbi:ABC transporter permease [Listeria rocourtiae]|uniref:ABC transporter permease n=1 Tax=Listeria rocourtiae TaxID=647910 RepID=UPI0016285C30|nr:ABC transporter permease [Listeria rocourtiae]MBC1434814.1 ABC transporter permease [Listeria rocourtiae]
MDFIRRACISIWAKKGKSFLMLILLFVLCSLVFAGFAIQSATEKSAENARKKLGGEVTLNLNMDKLMKDMEAGKQPKEAPPLKLENIEKVKDLEQVASYQYLVDASAAKVDKNPIKSEKKDGDQDIAVASAGGGGEAKMPDFMLTGTNNTDGIATFKKGTEKIVSGKGLTNKDKGNLAVIEKRFADQNKLKVGDTFKLKELQTDKPIEFTVHGIYTSNQATGSQQFPVDFMEPANKIYVPVDAAIPFTYNGSLTSATYTMTDPQLIDAFKKAASKVSEVDKDFYRWDANDEAYKKMMTPIQNVASFANVIVVITALAGGLILALLVLLSIRERRFEMGVLLSLGENKAKLIGQFLVEVIMIGMIAFSIACITSQPIGQAVTNHMLAKEVQQTKDNEENESPSGAMVTTFGGSADVDKPKGEAIDSVDVTISRQDMIEVGGIGMLVIIIATLLPCLFIIRLQPKMILSKND